MKIFNANKKSEKGQGMVEYIVIVGVIAIACITAFSFFGATAKDQVGALAQELSGQDSSAAIGNAQQNANEVGNQTGGLGGYEDQSTFNAGGGN